MNGRIDAWLGTVAHYESHLMPIIRALPEERRGNLYANRSLRLEVPAGTIFSHPPQSKAPLLVGGYQDTNTVRRPKVLVQHGAGQRYVGCDSPSYSGGPGRDAVGLFLCPREDDAQANRDRYHGATACAVGCPKLSEWAAVEGPRSDPPTVAVTFHWPAHLHRERADSSREMIPEAGWAFQSWRDVIPLLREQFLVVGHGHPRARNLLTNYWAQIGVEAEWDARRLLERADILIADNTSLGMEWMALGRPVVWLNDADWRKDIHHGGRFWDWVEGQIVLDPGDDLPAAVALALSDPPEIRAARERIAAQIYEGDLSTMAARAAEAVLCWEKLGCPHRIDYARTRPCNC